MISASSDAGYGEKISNPQTSLEGASGFRDNQFSLLAHSNSKKMKWHIHNRNEVHKDSIVGKMMGFCGTFFSSFSIAVLMFGDRSWWAFDFLCFCKNCVTFLSDTGEAVRRRSMDFEKVTRHLNK